MDRRAFLLGAPALLAACTTKETVFATQGVVDAAFVHNNGPTRIEVFSSFTVGSNTGAHTALLIQADQNVVFDPAGTFSHSRLPERHDVIYGMSESARKVFIDYHTRETYWTTLQSIEVSPETAQFCLRQAEQAGPVPDAMCTRSITTILAEAPAMPVDVRVTWFPRNLHDQLLDQPAVIRQEFRQNDDADKEKFWENNDVVL
ncbi:MAG: hypothetical protein AAGF13_08655 [Pseudomonadota bacterium]